MLRFLMLGRKADQKKNHPFDFLKEEEKGLNLILTNTNSSTTPLQELGSSRIYNPFYFDGFSLGITDTPLAILRKKNHALPDGIMISVSLNDKHFMKQLKKNIRAAKRHDFPICIIIHDDAYTNKHKKRVSEITELARKNRIPAFQKKDQEAHYELSDYFTDIYSSRAFIKDKKDLYQALNAYTSFANKFIAFIKALFGYKLAWKKQEFSERLKNELKYGAPIKSDRFIEKIQQEHENLLNTYHPPPPGSSKTITFQQENYRCGRLGKIITPTAEKKVFHFIR